MPRLPPAVFWKARTMSPYAPLLLPSCRDLEATANELRWIGDQCRALPPGTKTRPHVRLEQMCRQRGRGMPLQYVLGTQPFGDLDILCTPGVLIPRTETEALVCHLARRLKLPISSGQLGSVIDPRGGSHVPTFRLGVLDLCSGTGCISLLAARLLAQDPTPALVERRLLDVQGIDVSAKAVRLAQKNQARLLGLQPFLRDDETLGCSTWSLRVRFAQGDVLSSDWLRGRRRDFADVFPNEWDILVSNPPYVSAEGYAQQTARSVRNYEPKTALVPPSPPSPSNPADPRPEDVFYARLLEIGKLVRAKVMIFEVAHLEQAVRVVDMFLRNRQDSGGWVVEIWRDDPRWRCRPREDDMVTVRKTEIPVLGDGEGRSVFFSRVHKP